MVTLTETEFGILDGDKVKKFTWKMDTGLEISAISYGAIIQSIKVPDKHGEQKDIALGFDDLQGYLTKNHPDMLGCVVGRCAALIADGSFYLDGKEYFLTKNRGPHHLHGGDLGFDKAIWIPTVEDKKVIFSYVSKDGEQGYPGTLTVNLSYELRPDSTFYMEYIAMTNKKTIVNLTNHSYFNLAGHEKGEQALFDHTVVMNSDRILEVNEQWVPSGRFKDVGGTPYDLRVSTRFGDVIDNGEDLRFHHCYIINKNCDKDVSFISRFEHPPSGRFMEVYSDQPAAIFYSGNFIQGRGHPDMVGKGGVTYTRCGGFCIEPMNFVDAIHHKNFPTPILSPGQVYTNATYYKFGAMSTPTKGLKQKNSVRVYKLQKPYLVPFNKDPHFQVYEGLT